MKNNPKKRPSSKLSEDASLPKQARPTPRTIDYYQHYSKLYERLHAIEPSLAPDLPKNNFIEAYTDAFKKVEQLQQEEIAFLKEANKLDSKAFDVSMEESRTPLENLRRQSQIIDFVNSSIIMEEMNKKESVLIVRNKITRFPSFLFDGNESYWQNLVVIFLANNKLRALPKRIDMCKNLMAILCSNNRLVALPETLGNCKELHTLLLNNNQLTTLPESLQHCSKLEIVNCSNNRISFLPKSLGNCQSLNKLDCTSNHLLELPESLGDTQQLTEVSCNYNEISSLPKTLIKKMGPDWERFVLSNQGRALSLESPKTVTVGFDALRERSTVEHSSPGLPSIPDPENVLVVHPEEILIDIGVQALAALKLGKF